MKKLKVMTIIGTRPEIIRLSCIIKKLDNFCDHIIVHTGQNYDYELNQIFFDNLQIRKPDYFLNSSSDTPSKTIGNIISSIDEILIDEVPDAILVLGDTNSCLSVIPAKRRKIPIFHLEAGNRCYDSRVPEEINRKIIDHTSDVNLTYSSIARDCLIREGLPANLIIKTGSPLYEVINHYNADIQKSDILKKLKVEKDKYFLVSLHREENIDSEYNFKKLIFMINYLAKNYNLPVIFSTHPRTRKKIVSDQVELHPLINLAKPFGFFDYICLQKQSKFVLSDSGSIFEEASILSFTALSLRETQERHESFEECPVIMIGNNVDRLDQAISMFSMQNSKKSCINLVPDYAISNVSEKVLRIILSYTDYVNNVVWKKNNTF